MKTKHKRRKLIRNRWHHNICPVCLGPEAREQMALFKDNMDKANSLANRAHEKLAAVEENLRIVGTVTQARLLGIEARLAKLESRKK